jgi:hypothetical protein
VIQSRNPAAGPSATCASHALSRGDNSANLAPPGGVDGIAASQAPFDDSSDDADEADSHVPGLYHDALTRPSGDVSAALSLSATPPSRAIQLAAVVSASSVLVAQGLAPPVPTVTTFRDPLALSALCPVLPLLSSVQGSALDPLDRNLQDMAFCAGKFIPRSLRSLVFDGGESAWRRLGSKDRHLPLPRDQVGKGRILYRMSRFADDLGESVQVSATLGAATRELLDGYEVPDSILNVVKTLNQALSISLSRSAHISASLRLQSRLLRLESCKWRADLKEGLFRLPLFEARLFPTSLSSLAERETKESNQERLQSFLLDTASARPVKTVPPQPPAKPQGSAQTRGEAAGKGRGQASGRKRPAADSPAAGRAKQPFRHQRGCGRPA